MGLLNWLGVAKDIAEPIKAVGDLYTTDKARLEAQGKFEEIQQKPQLAQLENNRLLILTGKVFNSAWAPLIGWTSGACVFLYWVPQLLVANYIWTVQCFTEGVVMPFPIKPDDIYNLVWLLFGFGGYSLIRKKITG